MNSSSALVHLLGFSMGIVLYAMLGAMTIRAGQSTVTATGRVVDRIPLATSLLGLLWNAGALVIYGTRDLGGSPNRWLEATAFAALGFLPAVVVHSSLQGRELRNSHLIIASSYALSSAGALLQFRAVLLGRDLPSSLALTMLTAGYVAVIAVLALGAPRGPRPGWTLSAVALAAFAVMALHLQRHTAAAESLPIELIGHHASLPLAFIILYQDYRFALADIFLKRVVTLLAVVLLSALLYTFIAVPLLLPNLGVATGTTWAVSALIALWVLTALAYTPLARLSKQFVDRIVLRRADFELVRADIINAISPLTSAAEILDAVCARVAPALSARIVSWSELPDSSPEAANTGALVRILRHGATAVLIPTADAPSFQLTVSELSGGRRLLSDDLALLESIGHFAARCIDATRVREERHRRDIRENQIVQLAAEAELSALRAQLNPHFLFNTLTTIGHLIQEAPPRALDTLYRLTGLLRAVLKRSDGGFVTLGEEIEIVSAYLAIEKARFEERLTVRIDVPKSFLELPVPPLLLQPLVENAVKHGIAPLRHGGHVDVSARSDGLTLVLAVSDSGVFVSASEWQRSRGTGIGLSNLERRLERYYGEGASLEISSSRPRGTNVRVRIRFASMRLDAMGVTAERVMDA